MVQGHHTGQPNEARGFRSANLGEHNETGVHQLRLTAVMQHSDAPRSDQTYKHSLNVAPHHAMVKACTGQA